MSGLWSDQNATPAEALFEARDRIEELQDTTIRQGGRLLALAVENMALVEKADEELGGRYGRLSDAVHAIEHFTWACEETPVFWVEIARELLQDAIDYGESGRLSELLAGAIEVADRQAWEAQDSDGRNDG